MAVVLSQPEALEFQLEEGGEVYTLPLFTALTWPEIQALNARAKEDQAGAVIEYIEAHCPGLTQKATMGQLNQVAAMLTEASSAAGPSLGES